jgi:L-amino acid N-acyltransferase YncA
MLIRHADPTADAATCAAIYAPFVDGSGVSFEEVAPTADELRLRIESYSERHPWLVAQDDEGSAIGFAYAGGHRARAAYRWTVEVSVYIHSEQRRRGVGRRLYETLLPLLARQGVTLAVAGITLPNDASVALHEAVGFQPVGVYRSVGFKAGAWRDVSWWQCQLVDPIPVPPPELGPPARL